MVVGHRASAGGGDGMQLVVGQTAAEVAALEAKDTTRIWGFCHFLLDELDDVPFYGGK